MKAGRRRPQARELESTNETCRSNGRGKIVGQDREDAENPHRVNEEASFDRAARLQGKSRTDFMLEASREAHARQARTLGEVTQPVLGSAGPMDAPVPLTADDDTSAFVCRHDSSSTWLSKRAFAKAASGASRTYVVCDEQRGVISYYALAAGSIAGDAATGRLRRNMPEPLPVIVLGRLAVHSGWSGRRIGSGLLEDAVLRSIQAAELIGVHALLCHAIDEEAKAFYLNMASRSRPSIRRRCWWVCARRTDETVTALYGVPMLRAFSSPISLVTHFQWRGQSNTRVG